MDLFVFLAIGFLIGSLAVRAHERRQNQRLVERIMAAEAWPSTHDACVDSYDREPEEITQTIPKLNLEALRARSSMPPPSGGDG